MGLPSNCLYYYYTLGYIYIFVIGFTKKAMNLGPDGLVFHPVAYNNSFPVELSDWSRSSTCFL
jgi:hypothetical protein